MGPPLILLDTGPLIGLVDMRDQAHERSRRLFAAATSLRARIRTPFPAAQEFHWLLSYRPSFDGDPFRAALQALTMVLGAFPSEVPVDADMTRALESLTRFPDQKLSLADALIASMALRLEAQVMTLDERHFKLLGARTFRA